MKFNEMTIEQLKAYRAAVEVYGTASELYEVEMRIKELEGYPKWSRPTGAHDAYNTGDIVDYNGTLYKSLIEGNVWSPEEYPAGWEKV